MPRPPPLDRPLAEGPCDEPPSVKAHARARVSVCVYVCMCVRVCVCMYACARVPSAKPGPAGAPGRQCTCARGVAEYACGRRTRANAHAHDSASPSIRLHLMHPIALQTGIRMEQPRI
eukprot:2151157-Alexandrium_andersonii.AAC.1